jgi:hypothetical protein
LNFVEGINYILSKLIKLRIIFRFLSMTMSGTVEIKNLTTGATLSINGNTASGIL